MANMPSLFSLPKGSQRLYLVCLQLAVGASIWGYNIGVLSSILVHPGWRETMHDPEPSTKGLVTSVYYLGTLLSYLFLSHPLADWLGRRKAAFIGTALLSLGTLSMASARREHAFVAMMTGRFYCGLGVGIVSTTVPLYQSEIAPAKERGKFVTVNHLGFITGLATGLWVGYAMTFWKGSQGNAMGWRVSILIQLFPALIFAIGLIFLPETPRWLVQQGDVDQARKVLNWLREDTQPQAAINKEFHAISEGVDAQDRGAKRFVRLTLSLFREPALFARLWRAFLLQFMAQLCGATAMKYYLPTLLRELGLGRRVSLMAGALEMTGKIPMTILEMWLIDRFGRKICLVGGSAVMGVAMLVNGLLPMIFGMGGAKASDVVCIIFIFIYAMGYSLGLGPAAWVYSSEIFPTPVRARGLNFAASGGAIGSIIVSQVWPIGLQKLHSGVYLIFMLVNVTCVPVIWFLYPETKGRALEDMDALFGRPGTQTPALSLHGNPDEDGNDDDDGQGHEDREPRESDDEESAPLLSA